VLLVSTAVLGLASLPALAHFSNTFSAHFLHHQPLRGPA
jgi:hypothetical protein